IPMKVNLVSADEAAASGPDNEVIEEVVILKSARAQEEARKKADSGDYGGAAKTLRSAATELRKHAAHSERAEELIAEADGLEGYSANIEIGGWDASSAKEMHYNSVRQRENRRPHRED
ncbi:MAG TPA: hypothetical protein VFK89_11280, partial [Actinomycetota bacterium]|nr:hypothetical protein [Actinomycetota bacterium]